MYTENTQQDQILSLSQVGVKHSTVLLNYSRMIMSLVLTMSDLIGLLAAGYIAVAARYWILGGGLPPERIRWLPVMAAIGVLIYAARGLYPSIGLGVIEEFQGLTTSTTLVFVIFATAFYMLQPQLPFSRFVFAVMFLLSLVFVPANRSLIRHAMARLHVWGEPVVVIGPQEAALQLVDYLQSNPKSGLRPAALLTARSNGLHSMELPGQDQPLNRQLERIQTALVLYREIGDLESIRERYREAFERIVLVNENVDGYELSSVSVRVYGSLIGLNVRQSLLNHWSQIIKRIMDISLAATGLLILAPLFVLISLVVKIGSPGPIFYRQKRLGKGGREFEIIKFRTMYLEADQVLRLYLAKNPGMKAEWDRYQKLSKDPRLTWLGVFLRRFSLDELPQLWNVLIGQMSLVGPRPIMLDQRDIYGDNIKHYMRVLPGMTGLWQISGRSNASYTERTEFDVRYVNTWSIWLDIYILVRTVWVVLRADGAF